MKKIVVYLMILISSVYLCGCASYPDLSAEDMAVVTEYAAGLLLDYSGNFEGRLMDLEAAQEELTQMETVPEKEEITEPENTETDEEQDTQSPTDEEKEETTIIDNTEPEALPAPPINEVLGIENVSVQINGYVTTQAYPSSAEVVSGVEAKSGNSLIVTKLTLTNIGSEDITIDMFDKDVSYKVTLNGKKYQSVVSTLLVDDLSTYIGNVSAGASVELVLITEWNADDITNASNMMLNIEQGANKGYYPIP